MVSKSHIKFPLIDRSYLSITRRDITKLAEELGFEEDEIGKINIIVAELSSNIVKHTRGGYLLVKPIINDEIIGIEIISINEGEGMSEPLRMMEDGVSTYGSKGEGLGAIKRLSEDFDIYSSPSHGTIVLSRFYKKRYKAVLKRASNKVQITGIMVAKSGETACGDAWEFKKVNNDYLIFTADGLGHGKDAQVAAQAAVEIFQHSANQFIVDTLKEIHHSIKRTRGAVGAIALIDTQHAKLQYCGIGNIGGRILGEGKVKNLLSYNGTLGLTVPNTINLHEFGLKENELIILTSDGITSRWDLSKYPHLLNHDTSVIAAILYRDFSRGTDDSLVVVGKILN